MATVVDSALGIIYGGSGGGVILRDVAPSPYVGTPRPEKSPAQSMTDIEVQPEQPAPTGCNRCGSPAQSPGPSPYTGGPSPAAPATPAASTVTAKLKGLPWWVWPLGLLALAGTVQRA